MIDPLISQFSVFNGQKAAGGGRVMGLCRFRRVWLEHIYGLGLMRSRFQVYGQPLLEEYQVRNGFRESGQGLLGLDVASG